MGRDSDVRGVSERGGDEAGESLGVPESAVRDVARNRGNRNVPVIAKSCEMRCERTAQFCDARSATLNC